MKQVVTFIMLMIMAFSSNAQENTSTNNSKESTTMETQENTIAAKVLCDAFIKDKAVAEKKYGNRTMKITGYAVFVGPDVYGLPSVELSESKNGKSRVLCVLPFSDYLKLRRVSKGDQVVMEGEVRSIYEKDQTIVVKECKIIEVKKK